MNTLFQHVNVVIIMPICSLLKVIHIDFCEETMGAAVIYITSSSSTHLSWIRKVQKQKCYEKRMQMFLSAIKKIILNIVLARNKTSEGSFY